MWFTEAYLFRVPLSMPELGRALEAVDSWKWVDWDSERYGEYLMGVVVGPRVRLRIFKEGDRYALDIQYNAESADPELEWKTYRDRILNEILPKIGATDIEQTGRAIGQDKFFDHICSGRGRIHG